MQCDKLSVDSNGYTYTSEFLDFQDIHVAIHLERYIDNYTDLLIIHCYKYALVTMETFCNSVEPLFYTH